MDTLDPADSLTSFFFEIDFLKIIEILKVSFDFELLTSGLSANCNQLKIYESIVSVFRNQELILPLIAYCSSYSQNPHMLTLRKTFINQFHLHISFPTFMLSSTFCSYYQDKEKNFQSSKKFNFPEKSDSKFLMNIFIFPLKFSLFKLMR
jgi:hypothetical protein